MHMLMIRSTLLTFHTCVDGFSIDTRSKQIGDIRIFPQRQKACVCVMNIAHRHALCVRDSKWNVFNKLILQQFDGFHQVRRYYLFARGVQ